MHTFMQFIRKHRNLIELAAPAILGTISFFCVVGWSFLNPTNTYSFSQSDPNQHHLGWEFFRWSPWAFPIGLNPNFGLNPASTIVFSDSIPLLAIAFKTISHLLPEHFQYLGLWTLTCFCLQSIFAWKLISLFSNNVLFKITASFFISLAPIFLVRIGLHTSLLSHFLILNAIYLNLQKDKKSSNLNWTLLLTGGCLIHFYLFFIICILWLANSLDRFIFFSNAKRRILLLNSLPCILFPLIALFLAGYFVGNSTHIINGGYGNYASNLLGIMQGYDWSNLKLPKGSLSTPSRFESFNYLGAGILFLIPFAIVSNVKKYLLLKHSFFERPFFYLSLFFLTSIAITNQIHIGQYVISFPLPEFILNFLNLFRSSGRLFWPIYYVIIIGVLYGIWKGFSPRTSILLVIFALSVQIIDSAPGWRPLQKSFTNTNNISPIERFPNAFWNNIQNQYKKILVVMPQNTFDENWNWIPIAQLASIKKMGTNSAYLARVAPAINRPIGNEKLDKLTNRGIYDFDSLYILDPQKVLPVLSQAVNGQDLIAKIDDFYIYAPNYKNKIFPINLPKEFLIDIEFPKLTLSTTIFFESKSLYSKFPFLISGWSKPEAWGVWSDGGKASISLPLPIDQTPKSISLSVKPFVTSGNPEQEIQIWINGIFFKKITFQSDTPTDLDIPISPKVLEDGYLVIGFYFSNKISPTALGIGNDDRSLAIGLISAKFK
jgi:hypothetical protein